MNTIKKYQQSAWNEIWLMILAIISVGLLMLEFSIQMTPTEIEWIYTFDLIVALIFLGDFFLGLVLADSKKAYWKENWYLLPASIPLHQEVFQSLRALRLLRLVRIIHILGRLKHSSISAGKYTFDGSGIVYTITTVTAVILASATAFFTFEADKNPSVNNFFDALWWASTTATTVGYGDIYPATWEGRVVAIMLMFFGIGLVGAVAGLAVGSIIKGSNSK